MGRAENKIKQKLCCVRHQKEFDLRNAQRKSALLVQVRLKKRQCVSCFTSANKTVENQRHPKSLLME